VRPGNDRIWSLDSIAENFWPITLHCRSTFTVLNGLICEFFFIVVQNYVLGDRLANTTMIDWLYSQNALGRTTNTYQNNKKFFNCLNLSERKAKWYVDRECFSFSSKPAVMKNQVRNTTMVNYSQNARRLTTNAYRNNNSLNYLNISEHTFVKWESVFR
jgi:hypothetical protein